jgi:hypothetical protein
MVVSHYVVSGIQVIGGLVGMVGIVYLGQGFLSNSMNDALRRSLVGLAFVFLWLLIILPNLLSPRPLPLFIAIALLTAMFIFGATHTTEDEILAFERLVRVPMFIAAAFFALLLLFFPSSNVPWYLHLILAAGFLATFAVMIGIYVGLTWFARRAVRLTSRQLQLVGFLFTLVAVLPQLLPSVLDLVNIPVR